MSEIRTIFYAWQAQQPEKTNRYLIGQALEHALKELASDDRAPVLFTLDQDARGALGSPEISTTILRKIESCTIFVADVTPVGTLINGSPTPNPNVLFELGYAWHTIGENRIILVLNTALGQPEDLPFDISKRALAIYRLDDPANAAEVRKVLAGRLRSVISSMAQDDHLRPLRESGLQEQDCDLFKTIYSKMIQEDGDVCEYNFVLQVGCDLGLSEEDVEEATQMLTDNGFWDALRVMGPRRFARVRATRQGMEQYCKGFLPGYSKLPTEVGRRIVAGMCDSRDIAKATEQSEIVIEHLLHALEDNDYIRVADSSAAVRVFDVKPKLKRLFRSVTSEGETGEEA